MALLQIAGSLGCSEEPKEARAPILLLASADDPVPNSVWGLLLQKIPRTIRHPPEGTLSPPEDRSDIHVCTSSELGWAIMRVGLHDWVIEKPA